MKVTLDDGDRLVLSGVPGGRGTLILLLVVGVALSAGGAIFVRVGLTNQLPSATVMGGLVGTVGVAVFLVGVGVALTRDRLELDRVTNRGGWTRRLCGRSLRSPAAFNLEHAPHVQVEFFTETSTRSEGGGTTSVEKVRACLLVTKPRRRIVLDEAERQRAPRVEAVARSVAALIGLDVEGGTDADGERT